MNNNVNALFDELSKINEIEAIALGGSRAGEVYDEKSDYDVYLYCTAPVPEQVRRELLGRYCSRIEIGNSFWEYEDNCVLNNGIDIDILYRNLDEFGAGISRVVDEGNASNGYTTCMWHNLRTCKILYDRDGRLTALQARYDCEYPEKLRKNIIDRNMRLLRYAMPAYSTQIKKAVERGDLVSINHRVAEYLASYFDIIFAYNKLTHYGEKYLVLLCEKNCKLLPKDFKKDLERLFADMFTDGAAVLDDIKRITDNIEQLVRSRP
ncbi:MAG: DUF4037 domain-containing protein [Clostridiales bacterium]|nr:DUF4037 domain-containing protein [Clostridiales bacterium]